MVLESNKISDAVGGCEVRASASEREGEEYPWSYRHNKNFLLGEEGAGLPGVAGIA